MAVQLRYLRCSLNLISLSVERPMLSRPPDSPSSATRLRDCPALQVSYLSTRDRGAGQVRPLRCTNAKTRLTVTSRYLGEELRLSWTPRRAASRLVQVGRVR